MKLKKTRILVITKGGGTEYWPQYKCLFGWINFATFDFPVPIGELHKELYETMEDRSKSSLEFNKPLKDLHNAKHIINLYTYFVNSKNSLKNKDKILKKEIINYPAEG